LCERVPSVFSEWDLTSHSLGPLNSHRTEILAIEDERRCEMNPTPVANMHYKTRELNLLEKLLQVYWANPASWILDEFTIIDGTVTVTRKNGDRFDAPITAIDATFAVDNYDRREINIKCGDKKTRFKEIPGMLSEDEWNAIIDTLNPTKSGLGKLNDLLRDAKEAIKG
jgi:hypothetical protein